MLSAICHDVIVFGSGYAGFAAAWSCHRAGRRVLLVDRRPALLAESGWAFSRETGASRAPLWREWQQRLSRHAACTEGAIAEVLATDLLVEESLPVLYYATPVAVARRADGQLAAVRFATKAGHRILRACHWIDATDSGELLRLVEPRWSPASPQRQDLNLFFRHSQSTAISRRELPAPSALPSGTRLEFLSTPWAGESLLTVRVPGGLARPRAAWLPALQALHDDAGDALHGAVLTHGSIVPFEAFVSIAPASAPSAANVQFTGASGATLAEKFDSGIAAFETLAVTRGDEFGRATEIIPDEPAPASAVVADVGIAGLGTGGALAAVAAARQGARVCAAEAMPFPGGVGTGGGIHVYYFGVKGGLQEELDTRVRALMPLFGSPAQTGGFHPEAKKQALDALLAEAGVTTHYDAPLQGVAKQGERVVSADFATPRGSLRVAAKVWIDATGDGDLAGRAGAKFQLGRLGDGQLHAYGQSCGRAHLLKGTPRLQIINFDAGFCDPTDEQDLTRARIRGVRQYVQDLYDAEVRPTYIAPLIGIRQSRQFETDYTLTLDDLIHRRRFADAIGYTGCHYDNHARDYEFESDEAAFWVWGCQQWYGRLACQIPFGMLLPQHLDNVLLACRAAGVSEEAHHSFRMQRDMQRVGEAAGIAAALAVPRDGAVRAISLPELQARLSRTGALQLQDLPDPSFGRHADADFFTLAPGQLQAWLDELRHGPATEALWHLYRAEHRARPHLEPLLADPDDTVSWRAAAILAMWRDARAEPRLLRAIRDREDDRARDITKPQQEWFYMPRWYAAVTLLKRCLTPAGLPLLEELAAHSELELNLRNAIALAVESFAQRPGVAAADHARLERIVHLLLASTPPFTFRTAQSSPLGREEPPSVPQPTDLRPAKEDFAWQLHLAVLRARRALQLPPHEEARHFLGDSRAIVRNAFAQRLSSAPTT